MKPRPVESCTEQWGSENRPRDEGSGGEAPLHSSVLPTQERSGLRSKVGLIGFEVGVAPITHPYTPKNCSVQSIMSNFLLPHVLQHARLPVHHQLPELTQIHVH